MYDVGAPKGARTRGFPASEPELAATTALTAPGEPPTRPECALVREAPAPSPALLADLRRAIAHGGDPLGEAFCRLRALQNEERP